MEAEKLKQVIEAALMVTEIPLSFERMQSMFQDEEDPPSRDKLRRVLEELEVDYGNTGLELAEVASGYRFQARAEVAPWINRLFDERRPKYSRALLETLAIIAYRQPITRGEIENIRGVAVSTNIVRTLLEREWVRVVGHRDVPGRPSVYATTKSFLDYFNLSSLDQLPSLAELKDFDDVNADLFSDSGLQVVESDENGEQPASHEAGDAPNTDIDAGDQNTALHPTVENGGGPESEEMGDAPATDIDAVAQETPVQPIIKRVKDAGDSESPEPDEVSDLVDVIPITANS